MWSVSTTSVVAFEPPAREPEQRVLGRRRGVRIHVDRADRVVLLEPQHDRVALARELHRQRRDHDQRRALRAALQQRVVARIPLREPGAACGRQRIAALEHRERGGVAHVRRPDAENAVGFRRRCRDVGFDRRAADDPAALALGEVRLRAAERELVAAREQHAAREDLVAAAHGWRAGDRDAIADDDGARLRAAIAHHRDRGRLGIPLRLACRRRS